MSHILIVDDDDDARDAICRFLEVSGHKVDCLPNGREALAHIINNVPDVVLLDLIMPEMDGPSFL